MTQIILTANSFLLRPISEAIIFITNFFASVLIASRTRRAHRATERELHMLSDAELHDIGITRGDIRYVARTTETIANVNPNLREWV